MIICDCGHGINGHGTLGCIDTYIAKWKACGCKLAPEVVEARYWARRLLVERDNWKDAWEYMTGHYNNCARDYAELESGYNAKKVESENYFAAWRDAIQLSVDLAKERDDYRERLGYRNGEWLKLKAERDELRRQLNHVEELLDDWFDESGEYLSPIAIREQITHIKTEYAKVC